MKPLLLVPTPDRLTPLGGESVWPAENAVLPLEESLRPLLPEFTRFLADAAEATGRPWRMLGVAERREFRGSPHAIIVGDRSLPEEGYRLALGPNGISLFCREWKGALHGLQTLRQLLAQCPERFPHLEIEDAPGLGRRGYLLDISRTRVPRIATLERLIDQLARLKYNELQLYTEHTFAFRGHEQVWGEASPLTAEAIGHLDGYAAERGIELVPNFNCFGHFERWLRHPEYFRYAECPYGWRRPDGHGMPWGSTLTPSPESRRFVADLLDELLPLFGSRMCNIGGDEPWELGMGRSRERCETEGRHHVYLDFLHGVAQDASRHKERIQFWADIVLERPDIVSRLHPGLVAMVWGYEADHPLAAQAAQFARAGLPFYLCPGTSTWNSLGTRLTNALANIRIAGEAAAVHGAEGLLLTDWGDYGHHQPPIVSAPAIIAAAHASWQPGTELANDALEAAVARHFLPPGAAALAPVLMRLGRLGDLIKYRPPNRMPLASLVAAPEKEIEALAARIDDEELAACRNTLRSISEDLAAADLAESVADLRDELAVAIGLLDVAVRRALRYRPAAPNISLVELRQDFTALIGAFETCWVRAHRVGGLAESAGHLRAARDSMPSEPQRRPAWPPTARD